MKDNMTQEEILEYNKRCAEFLGAELYIPKPWYCFPKYQEHYYFKGRYESNRFTIKMLKFHSDWNWIMEVIEAIEKKGYELFINGLYCRITDSGMSELEIESSKVSNKKEAVVQAINQFLIWNENNNT
jgi:hypothetical protein